MKNIRILKTAVCLLCAVLSCFSLLSVNASAIELEEIPLGKARSVYLYNIENDKVLVEQNANEIIQPASTVKIMAGLIACETFGSDLDRKVKVTAQMREGVVGNDYGLKPGDTPTYKDLLYLAFCGCYNDAVSIISYVIAGSPDAFVQMLNVKAAELGMKNTHYTNATGLHDPAMRTTAKDTAVLSLAAYRSPLFMQITSAAQYTTEGLEKTSSFYNRNYLVGKGRIATYYNSLCHGLNAGSTSEAGYCVSTVAESDGISYLCIVMGAEADSNGKIYSYSIANLLIKWAYSAYGYIELLSTGEFSLELPVRMSFEKQTVLVVPEKPLKSYQLLSLSVDKSAVRYSHKLNVDYIDAPVTEKTVVGTVTVYINDEAIDTVNLVTKTSVARNELLYAFERIKEFTQSTFFIATLISAVILTTAYLIIKSVLRASANKHRTRYR